MADMRSRVQLTGSIVEAPLATPDARILHRRRRACVACLMAEERTHMLSVYSHSLFLFLSLCSHPTPGHLCLQTARRNPPLVLSSSSCVAISSPLSSKRAQASLSLPTIEEAASRYGAAVRISMGSSCFLECGRVNWPCLFVTPEQLRAVQNICSRHSTGTNKINTELLWAFLCSPK